MYLVCTCTYLLLLLKKKKALLYRILRRAAWCKHASARCPAPTLSMPTVKQSQAMAQKDLLEGGFLPSMTEEEQKRLTPSELLLYKHALEYRYKLVWLQYIQSTYSCLLVHSKYVTFRTKYVPFTFHIWWGTYSHGLVHTYYVLA